MEGGGGGGVLPRFEWRSGGGGGMQHRQEGQSRAEGGTHKYYRDDTQSETLFSINVNTNVGIPTNSSRTPVRTKTKDEFSLSPTERSKGAVRVGWGCYPRFG